MLRLLKILHAGALIDSVAECVWCVSEYLNYFYLNSSVGQSRRRRSHITVKICSNIFPSVLCLEPVIEIWVLICSLSLWHLIHPFPGWYNLASAWHRVTFFATGKSWQIVSAKCQFSRCQGNHRGDTVSIRATFSPSGSIWDLCGGSPNHPNCDGDQQHSLSQGTTAIQRRKCYIRSSSACKWRPLE